MVKAVKVAKIKKETLIITVGVVATGAISKGKLKAWAKESLSEATWPEGMPINRVYVRGIDAQ